VTRRLRRPDALTVHAAACLIACAAYAAGLVATDPHREDVAAMFTTGAVQP
jgi:hypothetical protein